MNDMKKRLEDIVNERRGEFDDLQPPAHAWDRIEAGTGLRLTSWWNQVWLWRAAAVVFMALSIYLYTSKGGAALTSDNNMAVLNEFRDVEAYYVQEISEKVELIDGFNRTDGLNGFTRDFHQLEAMYQVLKEEIKARPSQKVKDALVLNLLIRIDLLNQQLHKLEQMKALDKPESDEPNAAV